MNSFIINMSGGLGDQIKYFLSAYYDFYIKTDKKYNFIITDSGEHGGNTIKYYNFKKYINFEIVKIPAEILELYEKHFLINKRKNPFVFENDNTKIKPPFLIKSLYPISKADITTFRDMMQLTIPLNKPNKQKLKQIKDAENSVAIHIRMGDALKPALRGYLPKLSYIKNSILEMSKQIIKQKKTNNITFFIFSNSMDLVKARLNNKELQSLINKSIPSVNITFDFVDINKDEQPYYELELMKNCQHFIISEGGFSQLASLLGEYENKIIIEPNKNNIHFNKKRKDGISEKEVEWGYRWNYESNNWSDIEIIY